MNKVRVEIPVADGISVVMDADKSLGSGIKVESSQVIHCREYGVMVSFWPILYPEGKE